MDARDAGVLDARHGVAVELAGDGRFLRDRRVRRAGGDDGDARLDLRQGFLAEGQSAGDGMVLGAVEFAFDGGVGVRVDPRREDVVAAGADRAERLQDLLGRLELAVDHLGRAGAPGAVVVHRDVAGPLEVRRVDALERVRKRQVAGAEFVQHVGEAFQSFIHAAISRSAASLAAR